MRRGPAFVLMLLIMADAGRTRWQRFMAAAGMVRKSSQALTRRIRSKRAGQALCTALHVVAALAASAGLLAQKVTQKYRSRSVALSREHDSESSGVRESVSEQTSPSIQSAPTSRPKCSLDWDRNYADRKLWLLRRSGLFGENTRGAIIERACTLEDLRFAYRLVHDVYLGTGFIQPEPAGMRLRIFESTPEMATFVAKADGRIVGVLSVVADSAELGLPSDAAFKGELDSLRAPNVRLCEITNQAVAEEYRKSAVPTELMRCVVAHLIEQGIHHAIATVSPSHNSFYDLLGFRKFGDERNYSDKLHDPVVALSADIEPFRNPPAGMNATEQFINEFLGAKNHYLPQVKDWAKNAEQSFLDAELLSQLFVTERNLIAECSEAEREVLQRRWGHELFSAVTGALFLPSTESMLQSAIPVVGSEASPSEPADLSLPQNEEQYPSYEPAGPGYKFSPCFPAYAASGG